MPSLDKITIDGVDYDLVDSGRPTSLKNPNALTFTGAVSGSYDGSEAVSVNIPSADLSTVVKVSGSRGLLGGYEWAGNEMGQTISAESPDSGNSVTGTVTIANGSTGYAWTKVVYLALNTQTIKLASSWSWKDGEVPTIKSGDILVCTWCYRKGVASIISGSAS